MNLNNEENNFSEDLLLKSFTQRDVEQAKSNLLQRFQMWQGLLISADQKSVITPDDLENFRIQASDLIAQEVKSDQEWEQLKILTVLIYLLIDADKDAQPGGDHQLHSQLDAVQMPHAKDYIVRKILHDAARLNIEDITQLVQYENWVLGSYITSVPDENWEPPTITGLKSQDGIYFTLTDKNYEIEIDIVDAPESIEEVIEIEAPEAPAVDIGVGDTEPTIIVDDEASFLINTLQVSQLNSGHYVYAASYVGKGREHNEDAVVIQPQNNRVVVIDAMGGYGNGVTARDIFVDSLLKYPDNINSAVTWTQKHYDEVDVDQGGVCLISVNIEKDAGGVLIDFAQAGDVHAVLYDPKGNIRHETIDEAIGHQVINAVIGGQATFAQQANGWRNFGKLTRAKLHVKPNWRLAIYSDGVANHFNANHIASMILNKTPKQAIATVSKEVDIAMQKDRAYRDNTSIAIIDF